MAGGVSEDRVLVNPNGVDVQALSRFRERSAPERRRSLDRADAPTIGFIGTFGQWHGVEVLPPMAAALRADHQRVTLVEGLRSFPSAFFFF